MFIHLARAIVRREYTVPRQLDYFQADYNAMMLLHQKAATSLCPRPSPLRPRSKRDIGRH